ncbi:Zinc finger protein 143 [Colletotrichum orbiculare MAFF 240422]|uniref:C2H2 type master regulator of conidiophore development brlA n=1 Tax=Colletotrichum orbiculare (strain 104-T / ATCC 96160 / CBS 514.97 / LARS 414 / MAFF 240422) TaxID=1213857 RepID=A0A484FTK2_COLOR|nr:Zinc finger protein 143 [Colletotrichum orbiculare MAFF 240422]
MITPPPTDEPSSAAPPPRRSSSRASSLKTNLFGMLRRMSTKDSTTTRSKGYPTQTTSQVLREGLSDSPTELGPPTRELVPSSSRQLASPFAPVSPLSETGETDVAHDSKVEKPTESPPVLPPIAPAPGTVNPMDIMAPSNSAEHNWHTDRQLYHIAHPPPKPAEPAEKPAPTPEPSQALTPQSPELPFEQHQQYLQQQQQHQLHKQQLLQDQQQQQQQQWQQTGFTKGTSTTYVNGSAPTNGWHSSDAEQDIRMNDGPHLTDHSHLAVDQPYYRSSFDGNMTDPSDHSPAMAGHASSRASYQTTPNTLIDSSPSPRSDDSLDIRNSTSPYPGLQQSPRSFMCDECGRFFDQVHKLNHHKRYHERPHECAHPGCGKRFGTKTHLDRHINDKHKKTKKFHCTVSTCLYSKAGGKSFPRKDNWRRHMVNIHHVQPTSDPEPDMVDEAMGGT